MPSCKGLRAVVAGCVRNGLPHLSAVLNNCQNIASLYREVSFVLVENDSTDETKSILKSWVAKEKRAVLIERDGLASQIPIRTERIAAARNTYMQYIRNSDLNLFDHLVVLDFDDVNAGALDLQAFAAATEFMEGMPQIAGVFANSYPVYYDIWALRHKTWCPDDCWAAIRNKGWWVGKKRAMFRHIYSKQIGIPMQMPPIEVKSAFGGLGIYKLPFAIQGCYTGLRDDGEVVCEHVAFNESICRDGGRLYIFPRLQNVAPQEHIVWGQRLNFKNAYYILRYFMLNMSPSAHGL